MKVKLDRLKFQGENCEDYNRKNAISDSQLRTIFIIEKYFNDKFEGNNFGEAWDFIKGYINRTYIDDSGQEKRLFISGKIDKASKWEDFVSDNFDIIRDHSINFQEDYFEQRYKAMLRGESWILEDRYDDSEESCEMKEILYEANEDDEQLD